MINTLTSPILQPLSAQGIRRRNLQRLLRDRGTKVALAVRLGVSGAYITHLITDKQSYQKTIYEDTARAIEVALRLPEGDLDRPHTGDVQGVSVPHFAPVQPTGQPVVDAAPLAQPLSSVLAQVKTDDQQRLADIVTLAYRHNSAFGALDDDYVVALAQVIK